MTDDLSDLSVDALGLRVAVVAAERHCSDAGWDQPARLFALVRTDELSIAEPELAAELGVSDGTADRYTPVEQELDDPAQPLEDLLGRIMWPEAVAGALAVMERVVLPPEVESEVPEDPTAAEAFAGGHPEREDVRIAAGVLRTGEAHCVLRMRAHDDENALLHGPDLVPGLVSALRETLEARGPGDEGM
ncbi:MAG: PPA1309 family protein [Nocardioidaceae bacterium]